MIGETIGNYQVTGEIGAGGMGAVYEAEHSLLGKKVAVKVLLPELSHNRNIVERFFNEAKATATIKHPGIVEIFDYGHLDSGHAYIVMERLEGESLSDRYQRQGKLPADEAIAIARHIADVLGSAHAHGIVHRDLKPDNVFMVPDPAVMRGERAKILDFGIAKLADGTSSGSVRTQTGALMGTPVYMAPEQCRGAGTVDQRADIYALGCVLFEGLCGGPPFMAEGAGEIIAAHIHLAPPSPRTIEPSVPPAIEEVVLRLLAKDPDARYQSMQEVMDAFDAVTGHRHATTRPDSTQPGAGAATPMPTPMAGQQTTLGSAAGQAHDSILTADRAGWLIPAIAGIGLVGAIAIVLIVSSGGGGKGDRAAAAPGTGPAAPGATADPSAATPAPTPTPAVAPAELVTLTIKSKPTGADVYRAADGVKVGKTPFETEVPKGPGEAIFILKYRGYDNKTVTMRTKNDHSKVEIMRKKKRTSAKRTTATVKDTPPKKTVKDPPKKPERDKDGALDPFANPDGKSKDGAYKPFKN